MGIAGAGAGIACFAAGPRRLAGRVPLPPDTGRVGIPLREPAPAALRAGLRWVEWSAAY